MPGASHPTYQQCLHQVLLPMEGPLACSPVPVVCVWRESQGIALEATAVWSGLLAAVPRILSQKIAEAALTTHNPRPRKVKEP